MTDENRIVYPDEVADIKSKEAEEAQAVESNSIEDPPQKADETRIVFPDELEKIRADEEKQADKSNSIEGRALESDVQLNNMIQVPPNCPKGQSRGADGVCRDVF
ncbi:hypothetical protein KGM_212127 [Danaus plexippus plexippus]|uniref:Uncharacterized protein n=1 Tax=Danaus plexippus plexippus TaxID=278856 RepID=A0A212F1B1_DANPL|nr:hypothetical protein KGM_212127 [Danaus plexippus plexippus]